MAAFANAMLFSMRGILVFVIGFVMLAAAVSCGDAHYDARLAAIDSIIEERPDSALAGLRALGFGVFSRSDDRAYFALLLTEAQYKCYDSIASTDTIDLAVNHFTGNGDREKLTRSLIFKGATLEELGYNVEAMEYFKKAEETALSTDYHNLGYANHRMAVLYHNAYAESELHIDKYKRAYNYYVLAKDSIYQLKCLENLGVLYRASNMDSAYFYISKAIELAKLLDAKESEFASYINLSRAFEIDSLFEKQKEVALYVLDNGIQYADTNELLYSLCRSYSNLLLPDSAQYYFDLTTKKADDNPITRFLAEVDLREAKGDYTAALKLLKQAEKAAYNIEKNSERLQLFYSEKEYDRQKTKLKEIRYQRDLAILWSIVIVLIIVVSASVCIIYIKYRNNLRTLEEQLSQLRIDSILQLEQHLNAEKKLTESVASYIDKAKKLTEIYHLFGNHPQKLREKFLALLDDNDDKAQFWEVLRAYVNAAHNNAIHKITTDYPCLTESDIHFICMLMCNFSNALISVYMGYKNPHYVYNKKKMIAAKMGINDNIDIFINRICSK